MTNAQVEEILRRPYRRMLVTDSDSEIVTATIPEFPGCIAEGESVTEALANLESVAHAWVESLVSRGVDVPSPTEERDFSGRFPLRLPRSLHERVAQLAEDDGVSLNTFLVTLIARHVGVREADNRTEEFLQTAVQQLHEPRLVQFRGVLEEASTGARYSVTNQGDVFRSAVGARVSEAPSGLVSGLTEQSINIERIGRSDG